MKIAFLLALLTAIPAPADCLRLDHAKLEAKARKGLAGATLSYTDDRVILRGRVQYCYLWFPVRIEASFEAAGGRVRLVASDLFVRGRAVPSRLEQANDRLAQLVDVETEADRVDVFRAGKRVYSQELDPALPAK